MKFLQIVDVFDEFLVSCRTTRGFLRKPGECEPPRLCRAIYTAPARLASRGPWSRPRPPWQNELNMTSRFLWALGVYAALALMAAFTLDGKLRAAVWILLGGLTVKTCIAYKAGW